MIYSKNFVLTGLMLSIVSFTSAQNLIVNPGAELSPSATGWTVASSGSVCSGSTAADTYNNWTMVPDNSANYPSAHGGSKTFFAGCSTVAGSFELYQDLDVSSDASQIDLNNVSFAFSGYIQTPVNTQSDEGKFTIDFMNASNTVLGTSYSAAQSNSAGSGTAWKVYNNTRTAPVGTRKIRIRLIASITTTPAINAYFDDLSMIKSYITPLPVKLVSFTGKAINDKVALNWKTSDAVNFQKFEVERSADQQHFITTGVLQYKNGLADYTWEDHSLTDDVILFYRLKMIDVDGKYSYSPIVQVSGMQLPAFSLSPNPASKSVLIRGLKGSGTITITSVTGFCLLKATVSSSTFETPVSQLPKGIYLVTYTRGGHSVTEKLFVK